jgi:hypothetical protein
VPIGDKSWISVDDIRQAIWIAGAAFFGLIGFDGTTRAAINAGDGISTAYADASGGHFIGAGGFQTVVWDGVTAPQLEGDALPAGDIASTWTTSTVSMSNAADGGQWILRALHDSVGGSPIVVRVRHLPDEGVDVPISKPGTLNFLPVGVLDDRGRLHAVWYESGSGLNPKIPPSGVKGSTTVTTTVNSVAMRRYFDGLLLKNGFRLRMTSTIRDAEITDSRNQPVLNWS